MSKKRILVIDDDEFVQSVIRACLEDIAEWEVLNASSGARGLLIAAAEPLDGILLDVSMPDMDGIKTLEKLQGNLITKSIPVAFLTAKVQPSELKQFSSLAIAGVIFKPFDALTLAEKISQVFGWN